MSLSLAWQDLGKYGPIQNHTAHAAHNSSRQLILLERLQQKLARKGEMETAGSDPHLATKACGSNEAATRR